MKNLILESYRKLRGIKFNIKILKILIFLLLLGFFGSFLIYKITLPIAQDLPRQMQNGKDVISGNYEVLTKNVYSYTEPDQSFANHHWFYGVMMYVLHGMVGYSGMVIFKVILLLSMFCLLFYITQKAKNYWLSIIFAIPSILILINRTSLRPEIFSFFFVVVFLYLLLELQNKPKIKKIFWLIPLQLIWVNTHLFFAVGIMMVLGMIIQDLILYNKGLIDILVLKKLFIVFLSLIVVSFINPFGLWGVVFSLIVNTSSTFPISSGEITPVVSAYNLSPGWDTISATIFFPSIIILSLSFIVSLIYRWKNKMQVFSNNYLFYLLASIGSALLPFVIIRGMPLFAIIFLPAIVSNLNEPLIRLKDILIKKFRYNQMFSTCFFAVALSVLIMVLIIIGQKKIMGSFEQGIGLARYSESPAQFFKDNKLKGPIFNDTDIGSYLIGELYPEEKVFSDNRFGDAYSKEFFSNVYLPMLRDENVWREKLDEYKFNVIFFYHYDALEGARDFIYRRIYDPEWAWVYVDNAVVILVKNKPENQDIIDKYRITNDNLIDRTKFLFNSKFSEDRLTAADIYNLVGKFDLSIPAYQQFVSEDPTRGKAWMVLGRTELTKSDQVNSNPHLAALFLERALKEGWKTWETYSYLALAYYRTGQLERAKEMVNKEEKLDPSNLDVLAWKKIIKEDDEKLKYSKQ